MIHMQELLQKLMTATRDVWRYRWYAVATAWVIALAGWTVVSYLPDKHTATAQVYVDTATMLEPLLEGLVVEQDKRVYLRAMMSQLFSRANLEEVARLAGLDRQAQTPMELEIMLDKLKQNIQWEGRRADHKDQFESLFSFSYENVDPKIAKQVIEALLTTLTENITGANKQDSDAAKAFVEQQIVEYEAKLTAAENRLREFKRQNIDVLPEQGRNYFSRLNAAQAEIQEVELQVREAEQRRNELQRQLTETSSAQRAVTADGKLILTPVESRLTEQQTRLDNLLLRFTEKHPDVIETRRTIAELEKQRQAELQGSLNGVDNGSMTVNPVFQQLKLSLGEVESELAGLRVRMAAYQQRVQDLQRQVEILPAIEAELQRLDRDYEVNRQQYTALLSRREAAEMATDVDQTKINFKFSVIDPPRVSLYPANLKRLLLTTAVLGAGLVGGIGFALLLSLIQPVVHTRSALEELTGLPVVATISRVWTPQRLLRRRLEVTTLASTGILLMGAYGAVLFMQLRHTELMANLLRTLGNGE
jgi:polysaccharide chain length determinant protein (PEP-CTERM system associated)